MCMFVYVCEGENAIHSETDPLALWSFLNIRGQRSVSRRKFQSVVSCSVAWKFMSIGFLSAGCDI